MITELWNKIKDYKKTLYVSAGVGSLIIGLSSIGFLVKKKYIRLPSK
jgi:hypothetical protein